MNSVLRIEEYNMKIRFTFGTSELVSSKNNLYTNTLWNSSSFESECNMQSRGVKVFIKTIHE